MSSVVPLIITEVNKYIDTGDFLNKKEMSILLKLYNKNRKSISELVKTGFNKKNNNINYNIWLKFISSLVVSVEKYKKLSGSSKENIVIELSIIVIQREVKITDDLKELLSNMIRIIVPEMIDLIISVSKEIHVGSKKIISFLKKLCCKPKK